MKLTPAEELAVIPIDRLTLADRLVWIRQIQANAIRWATWIIRDDTINGLTPIGANLEYIENRANQLDPLPEKD